MIVYRAKFIGTDGSLGYRKNKTYAIYITMDKYKGKDMFIINKWIRVMGEPDGLCPYESLVALLKNWTDIQIECDSPELF